MINNQKTIKSEFVLSGKGLHTGVFVNATFKPAPINSGIQYVRTDLPLKPLIKADASNIRSDGNVYRCSSIGYGEHVVYTVEHLMSALCGLRITNLIVELDGPELPGLDGSGKNFLEAIKKSGIQDQEADIKPFTVLEPVGVESDGCSIFIVPSNEYRISYTLDYPHPILQSQFIDIVVNPESYEKEIASSRTFCLESEVKELQSKGLGQGANYQNTLVVGNNGVIDNKLRFVNEFARHKVLDLIGDLYLLGAPIQGHIFAVKSGHKLNTQLLKKISAQKIKWEAKNNSHIADFAGKKEIDIKGIMKILPHRYPFLLVDRVVEIEQGKRGVGIKNVTFNEPFFQGHFPTRPVMPGVMMVEAMAQTAGVVVLTNEAHHDKLAFFMAADQVKFRKVVSPGDQLVMEVEVIKDKPRIAQIKAVSKVDGEIVAEAEMVFSFTDKSYLDE